MIARRVVVLAERVVGIFRGQNHALAVSFDKLAEKRLAVAGYRLAVSMKLARFA
jgi:hypothetical protein